MTFSSRETLLAWVTMAILLGGATYLLGRTRLGEWTRIQEERRRLAGEIILNEELASQGGAWTKRFDRCMSQLNVYPPGLEVTPKLLEALQQLAEGNNLTLASLSPENEKSLGDVYEVGIKCTWQGDLDAIVRFLHALQSQGAMYKVRRLTVTPTGKSNQLKGVFTLDCAYARAEKAPRASGLEVVPVPAE